jgi:hypothetical protein
MSQHGALRYRARGETKTHGNNTQSFRGDDSWKDGADFRFDCGCRIASICYTEAWRMNCDGHHIRRKKNPAIPGLPRAAPFSILISIYSLGIINEHHGRS